MTSTLDSGTTAAAILETNGKLGGISVQIDHNVLMLSEHADSHGYP